MANDSTDRQRLLGSFIRAQRQMANLSLRQLSALTEVSLPRAQLPVALLTFNLGVEAGQLAVLAVLLPLLFVLRKVPAFKEWGVRVVSAGIVVAGAVWFVARVFSVEP